MKKAKVWKRSGKIIKHHIVNKVRKGKTETSNLLKFDRERERAWHFLFGNKSFEEVAELLTRTQKMKRRQK